MAAFTRNLPERTRNGYRLPCPQNRSGQSGRDAENSRFSIRAGSPAIREFVEQVHALVVYRREVMQTPIRTLAAEIGISKSAVDKFHKERSHPGKLWPRLRDWYMRTHATKRDEYRTPPDLMVATALQLLSQVPKDLRAAAIRATAEHLKAFHPVMPDPDWIEMLSEIADREEGS